MSVMDRFLPFGAVVVDVDVNVLHAATFLDPAEEVMVTCSLIESG